MWRNKYDLYESSVQSPEADVVFIEKEYKKIFSKKPQTIREDFCGTGALLKEWVSRSPQHIAYGIDLDQEPIEYGIKLHRSTLDYESQKRMIYINNNVLKSSHIKADVVCAFNYSYFIFKERKLLLEYFRSVYKSLNKKGLFFIDVFGGYESMMEIEESRNLGSFSYYWECQEFNPLSNEGKYAIHFKKRASNKKFKNVFSYDWRLWSVPELKDLLIEAGFKEIITYWEGDSSDGKGNGIFKAASSGENCLSWLAYIVARA